MKKLIVLCIIISMLFCSAFAKEEEFLSCVDGGSLLSEEAERYMYVQNKILSEKTGARIVVATEVTVGDLSVEEYANSLYEELGVNRLGRNNSVFLFLSESEKDYFIKVSDGIVASLTIPYAQKCLVKYMEKDFENGNYEKAVIKSFNAFARWYADEYGINLSLTEDMSDYKNIIKSEKERKILRTVLILTGIIVFAVSLIYAYVRHRRKKLEERLLRKRQERRRRYTQSISRK